MASNKNAVARQSLAGKATDTQPVWDENLVAHSTIAPFGPERNQSLETISGKELELFVRNLGKMLDAKISLEKSLNIIASGDPDLERTLVAKDLHKELTKGKNLSDIFGDYVDESYQILVPLLKSGELSGNLGQSVSEMEKLIVTRNNLTNKVQSSMVYPAILLLISLLSLLSILFYVIPQFSSLIGQGNAPLPMAATVVFWLSDTVIQWWWLVLGILGVAAFKAYSSLMNGGVLQVINGAFSIIPGFTDVPDKIHMNTTCRLLGTLLSNNVKLLDAFDVVGEALEDEDFREALADVTSAVKTGSSVEQAFSDTQLFSFTFLQMVRIGEESGDLGGMLLRAAEIFEEEIDTKIKRFLILFEPLILLGIGVMIGGLLYGLFSAILSVNNVAF